MRGRAAFAFVGVFGLGFVSLASRAYAADLASAEQLLAQGDYAGAKAQARGLTSGTDAVAAQLLLARVQLETGRYAEAEQSAALAELDPKHKAAASTQRAEALEAVGKLDEAEHAYRSAATDPDALRARVLLGRLLLARGHSADAKPLLTSVVHAYEHLAAGPERAASLAYVAMAARALGHMHEANDTFREAAEADHARVETQLEWAALFMEKYDLKHAAESVLEALSHNKHDPRAHVLMARLALSQSFDFNTASEAVDRALAVNPNLVAAYVTQAGMALRNMELTRADAALDRALAVNPVDLEALSVRGAVRFLADDRTGFAKAKALVLAQNPHFSSFYAIVADYAEWEHRYADLVAMSRAALAIDKNDAVAHATLGLNLLRMGEEREGLAELEAAWKRDHFNVQVFNTLNLYEDEIEKHYDDFTHGPFRFRVLHDERPMLEPYLVPMVEAAYANMQKRYAFTPEGPLAIELYADREQFSVRTTGLPNVGVQGVCFGKVVTALSPRGGPFNWGQIVWHELSHVFHLQLSKNHVPRWFTEGLAEYETTIARPEWKREDDYTLWQALYGGKLPALSQLNRAFTHARKPEDLMTAYYASYKVVAYIVSRFGFERVRPMLVMWGEGKSTQDIVQSVLGISIDTLDHDFRAETLKQLSHYDAEFHLDFSVYADVSQFEEAVAKAPMDADAWAGLAFARVLKEDYAAAEPAAKHALLLSPKHKVAHFALARIALEQRNVKRAERCLRGIVDGGSDGYVLRMMLSRAALARGSAEDARTELEAATRLEPDREEAWKALLEIAEKLQDTALATRVLGQIAALDQHDRTVHEAYALLLAKEQRWPELVQEGESAMYIAPESAALHHTLGRAYLETGDPKRALVELDRALLLAPSGARAVEIERSRARALHALGDEASAKKAEQHAGVLAPAAP